MSLQHSTEQREAQREASGHGEEEGVMVPLDLGAFRIRKQQVPEDGSIEVEVIATSDGHDARIVSACVSKCMTRVHDASVICHCEDTALCWCCSSGGSVV